MKLGLCQSGRATSLCSVSQFDAVTQIRAPARDIGSPNLGSAALPALNQEGMWRQQIILIRSWQHAIAVRAPVEGLKQHGMNGTTPEAAKVGIREPRLARVNSTFLPMDFSTPNNSRSTRTRAGYHSREYLAGRPPIGFGLEQIRGPPEGRCRSPLPLRRSKVQDFDRGI